ncbi:MAG: hypothetical protein E7330_01665 [Clostridiales bacterium]|nr:hypothetical protein [Clostridiales bacterium]
MELPKRKHNRLRKYDYSTPNAYFITICTKERKNLFWMNTRETIDCPENVPLTELGASVKEIIYDIPGYYPTITVDHAVIMPNHIHLLLRINTEQGGRPMAAPTGAAETRGRPMAAPTISTVINQVKGAISKKAGFSVWQKGFYDHVIRGKRDYLDVWNYIEKNPGKWAEDKLFVSDSL